MPDINLIESLENDNITLNDPIDIIIQNFSSHPSVLKIKEHIDLTEMFTFEKVNEIQIETEVKELNSKKAPGVDGIPANIIKESIDILKPTLTKLFNFSVEMQHFPNDLKYANVTPLFKKNEDIDKTNYRPISILPSISKIFERLMFKQITAFVENKISHYLCGFRKGYNTQHALLRLIDQINKSLDRKEKVGILMMDLSNAFDCISHDLLIAKLSAYGIETCSLRLIYSYLKDRKQRVKINSDYSTWKDVLTGVPQGSVLGPLLFNIFINDLFFSVENSEVCNFADDNTLSVANSSIEQIINKLETDIDNLQTWFLNNGMLLNETKCQFQIMETTRSIRDKTAKIRIQNKSITEVTKGKLLGVTVDNNLTMKDCIQNVCKQARNKLKML